MSDMKKMTLTYGENYSSYDDSVMFMENFKQHLLEESVLSRFPEVVDDLVNNATHLVPELLMFAESLDDEDVEDKVNHALCVARIAMRIAAYYAAKDEMENEENDK